MFLLQNAQLGGLISGLIETINNWFSKWLGFIFDWLISTVWAAIATGIYTYFIMPILLLIDGLSIVFRKFVGLGSYSTTTGQVYENNDFLYALITNDSVKNVFWAMLILGIILLFITTFVAVVKSETTPLDGKSGDNNKWKVLKTTFRALLNFAIVPICAFLGIMIGNVLLRSLDSATGGGDNVSMANRVFVSSAYQANRVRRAIELENTQENYNLYEDYLIADAFAQREYKLTFDKLNDKQKLELAQLIDDMFILNGTGQGSDTEYCTYWNIVMINEYYNIGHYNLLLGMMESIAIAVLMIILTIGVIKRLFSVVTLFVIAPPIIAVSPLQPKIVGQWSSKFLGQVIAGYAGVVAMNMYLIIMRAMSDIQFISVSDLYAPSIMADTKVGLLNSIIMVLIAAAGLFFVKDISKDISGIIGADDALAAGQGVANKLSKAAGMAVGLGVAGKAVHTASTLKRKTNSQLKSAVKNRKQAEEALHAMENDPTKTAAEIAKQRQIVDDARIAESKIDAVHDVAVNASNKAGKHFMNQSVHFGEQFSETSFRDVVQKDKFMDDQFYGKDGKKAFLGDVKKEAQIAELTKNGVSRETAEKFVKVYLGQKGGYGTEGNNIIKDIKSNDENKKKAAIELINKREEQFKAIDRHEKNASEEKRFELKKNLINDEDSIMKGTEAMVNPWVEDFRKQDADEKDIADQQKKIRAQQAEQIRQEKSAKEAKDKQNESKDSQNKDEKK